ncbi:MAG: DNA repair protein RadC [Clostridia bacterium]|nr:DNA repair protein RadC [Clostridia bacterium]
MKIKELPEVERPYEKLELYGEKALSNAELLAIIIKNGTKDKTSIEMANEILNLNQNHDKGDINFLQDFSLEELKNIKGIGRVKAIQIKAMCELAGRMSKPSNYRKIQIKGPNDVANLLMNDLRFEKREIVKVVIINNKNIVLKILDVAIGSGNCSNLNIRYILSETVKMNAPKIILVHNHPSGDPTPTKQDIFVTEKLKEAAELLKIELLDHIVIGNMRYKSIMS